MAKIYKIIVFIFFFSFFPFFSYAANLYISPASASFQEGEKIVLQVMVSTRTPINAISGVLNIPTSLFTIESVTKAGSVLNFWVTEPNFSKGAGTLQFEGVVLGGYEGGTKGVINVSLRAKTVGTGDITFKSGKVLANDGQGTDVTDRLISATYSITPKKVIDKPIIPIPVPAKEVIPEPEETIIEEAPQAPATLSAPEIELGLKFGEQAIYGKSKYPKSQALVTFVAQNGVKVFITGETDEKGEFLMLVPHTLKRGVYTVSAIVVLEDFSNSHESNKITITVGNIFSDIGLEIWAIMISLLATILYLVLRIHFHFKKDKNVSINKAKTEEIEKDETLIHKSFDALRADVVDRSRGVVSEVERGNIEELKKDIDSTEKQIFKEIKDIEKS